MSPADEKRMEALLYVVVRVVDRRNVLVALYYADRLHLERYGRKVCDGRYRVTQTGVVSDEAALALSGLPHKAAPRDPDMSYLSETDVECLDDSIRQYGTLSLNRLRQLALDEGLCAGKSSGDEVPLGDIIRDLPNAGEVMEYLEMV